MAATFTAGVTWGGAATSTLTASLLGTFVNGTIIANIGTGELSSLSRAIWASTQAPAAPLRALDYWRDLDQRMTRRYDGVSQWQGESQGYVFLNTAVAVTLGTVLSHGATNIAVSVCQTLQYGGVVGIAAEPIANMAQGLVRFSGVGSVLVTGTCTAGDVLVSHGVGSPSVGGAARAIRDFGAYGDAANKPGLEVAIALYNNAGVAGGVTCLVLR